MRIKAICMTVRNSLGIHRIIYDEHVAPMLWASLPTGTSGTVIEKKAIRRPKSQKGMLDYKLIESFAERSAGWESRSANESY